jgi:hypothetical protein
VAHSGEDATEEFNALFEDKKLQDVLGKTVPLSIADGLYIAEYRVSIHRLL